MPVATCPTIAPTREAMLQQRREPQYEFLFRTGLTHDRAVLITCADAEDELAERYGEVDEDGQAWSEEDVYRYAESMARRQLAERRSRQ